MHLTAMSMVELFPKLQFLGLDIYPDRFSIEFSFSRTLSPQEIEMLKDRFFEKIKSKHKANIREMVTKNVCDLFKHYKQIFMQGMVDRDEMFTMMFCDDLYNGPLIGEINQEDFDYRAIRYSLFDLGEKKWMKKKIHHYRLEGFIYFTEADYQNSEKSINKIEERDHRIQGKKNSLFSVNDGEIAFMPKGEADIEELIGKASEYFGGKIFFTGEVEDFYKKTEIKKFHIYEELEGNYTGIDYGLKSTNYNRSLMCYDFSNSDLKKAVQEFTKNLGLFGEFDSSGQFIITDYKGIEWKCAELFLGKKYLSIEINLLSYFALILEK